MPKQYPYPGPDTCVDCGSLPATWCVHWPRYWAEATKRSLPGSTKHLCDTCAAVVVG
jgi:hypothetical protein